MKRRIGRSAASRLIGSLTLSCLGLAAIACGSGTSAADRGSAAQPPDTAASDAPRSARTVRLDTSQTRQIHIETVSPGAPAQAIHATGTVEFNGDRLARILPPVSGQVQELTVNIGDTVRKGDVLFVLSSREVAAAIADHVAAHRDADLAQKTYAMTQDLFEHEAASRISLQQAESDLAKAHARVLQSEEILRVLGLDVDALEDPNRLQSRIPIRTPISGTVTERTVTDGQFVAPDNALLVIADLSSVWVLADVFERDLHSITPGQKADVTTAAYPADRFIAEVSRIGTTVDAQTRTAKVRFLVANPGRRLKPGMFTSASLYLPDTAPALSVAASAVFVENGRSFAYLQQDDTTFLRREVETAPGSGARLRVVRGLAAGDRVVSDGVLLLRQLETDAAPQ